MTLKRRVEELEGTFGDAGRMTAEGRDGMLLWVLAQITPASLFSEAQRAALDGNAAYRRQGERVASREDGHREKPSDVDNRIQELLSTDDGKRRFGNLMLDAWERQIPDVPPPLARDPK